MPLSPGTTLGPYQIDAPLGAGGMGEVYKATDTRLDRTVAIKVLPEHVAADPDLKQRFEHEARTVAALIHPHICTLYDVGKHDGRPFIAMELLEGQVLSQRIASHAVGTLPFTGKTSAAQVDSLLHHAPTPPRQLSAEVPDELARIIDKALEKDRRLRYQTASDLRSDLARLRRDTDSHSAQVRGDVDRKGVQRLRIIHPWEVVARDGREFARQGVGIMYWFRVPLGEICFPEGFRNALQPALENPRISKVRFVLDSSAPAVLEAWDGLVIPLLQAWAKRADREIALDRHDDGGRFVEQVEGTTLLTWVATDLSEEFSRPLSCSWTTPTWTSRASLKHRSSWRRSRETCA